MTQDTTTRYVTVGDADVAYQVIGDGPIDLLYFYGLGSHLELLRLTPGWNDFLGRLTAFSRVILFDRRGSGASDGVPRGAIPSVESWAEDVHAVLDAAGSNQAAIVAAADAGPIALLFAALHPERVSSLVLLNTTARYLVAEDYPTGQARDDVDALVDLVAGTWGTADFALAANPGADDLSYLAESARWARFSATPHSAAAQYAYLLRELDVRAALPLVQAPTRVLHVAESPIVPLAHGRYLAEHIADATLTVLPGGSLSMTPNLALVLDELSESLTGHRLVPEVDRVLTTIVFTDIVDSTARAAALGDHRWRDLLDAHDGAVRAELARFRGTEVNTTGDGFLAAFDGPGRAIRCCEAIIDAVTPLGIEVRGGAAHRRVRTPGQRPERTRCSHRRPSRFPRGPVRDPRHRHRA